MGSRHFSFVVQYCIIHFYTTQYRSAISPFARCDTPTSHPATLSCFTLRHHAIIPAISTYRTVRLKKTAPNPKNLALRILVPPRRSCLEPPRHHLPASWARGSCPLRNSSALFTPLTPRYHSPSCGLSMRPKANLPICKMFVKPHLAVDQANLPSRTNIILLQRRTVHPFTNETRPMFPHSPFEIGK